MRRALLVLLVVKVSDAAVSILETSTPPPSEDSGLSPEGVIGISVTVGIVVAVLAIWALWRNLDSKSFEQNFPCCFNKKECDCNPFEYCCPASCCPIKVGADQPSAEKGGNTGSGYQSRYLTAPGMINVHIKGNCA